MNYWIIKSEPDEYSIDDLKKDHNCSWDGVRNYQARNNMKAMAKGDILLFYQSLKNPAIVGAAKLLKTWYPDPEDERFVLVDIEFSEKFAQPLTLAWIKNQNELQNLKLIKQPRLSVMPITIEEYDFMIKNIRQ